MKALLKQSKERVHFEKTERRTSYYSRKNGEKKICLSGDADNNTISHELFHEIDNTYKISESDMITNGIKQDFLEISRLGNDGVKIENVLYSKYPNIFAKEGMVKREYGEFSDILHGISNKAIDLGYGHYKKGYWDKPYQVEMEV